VASPAPTLFKVRRKRPAARFIGWVALASVLGGCQDDASTELTIHVNARKQSHYSLRCDPPGGDLPRASTVCAALTQHHDLFLNPPPTRFSCRGGPGIPPEISIEGRYRDRPVQVAGRSCDWPGGLGLAVIEGALGFQPLEQAVARLRCGEEARLLLPDTPLRKVGACLADPPS
jgi:hypothetical protein